MTARRRHLAQVRGLLRRNPVVAILGARQVGKTTLARALSVNGPRYPSSSAPRCPG